MSTGKETGPRKGLEKAPGKGLEASRDKASDSGIGKGLGKGEKAGKDKGGVSSRVRPLQVLTELMRGKRHDRRSIAEHFAMSTGTADRVIRALEKVPGVVGERKGKSHVVRFDPSRIAPPLGPFTPFAACFGASLSSLFEGTDYESGMRAAARDVLDRSRSARGFKHVERKFLFVRQGGEPSLRERSNEFHELVNALMRHRILRFGYRNLLGRVSDKRVEPLSIAVYDHQLYLVARDAKGHIIPYRFSRTARIEAEDATFEYPSAVEYDPHQLFAHSFGIFLMPKAPAEAVVVKLTGTWAELARAHRWHPTQKVKAVEGAVVVEIKVPICPEVETWALGFGEHGEILEPPGLKETIAKRVMAAAAKVDSGQLALGIK